MFAAIPPHRTTAAARLLVTAALGAVVVAAPAHAAGTRAGVTISNTATASFDTGGGVTNINSNRVDLLVDELLDVTVASNDPADVVTTPGATNQLLTFRVTNTGNGSEAFVLSTVSTLGGDNFDPTVTQIIIDNGDGIYEPGIDTVYVPGAGDPVLEPDAGVTIFVLSTIPGSAVDADRGIVRLVAAAKTGTGTPGTSFAGAGEGGGDAVVGATGADGQDEGAYAVASASVALVKSATIVDPFGGDESVPGSVITYQIVATVTGSGSVSGLTITDAVPATTTFVPGSITLDTAPLTDASDADAGSFASGQVAVGLGTVAGGTTRTVRFRATIQ